MGNITQEQYDKVCESYRADFPYLNDHRYELLTMAAGNNADDSDTKDEEEHLKVFGATMEGFTQYTRKDIEDIC